MNLDDVLENRRSIRQYKEEQIIPKESIESLIEAAILAPSWKNSQTGRYYVVSSSELLEKVKRECLPEFNQKSCKNAPVLIVTAFEKNRSGFTKDGKEEDELGNGWGCYDLGLQNENLMLKATELGLGTLVMGIRDSEKLRDLLLVPDSQEIVSVIAVGYFDVQGNKPKRKEVKDIAKFF